MPAAEMNEDDPQPLQPEKLGLLLDYVGNHEAKTAVAALMLSTPDAEFGRNDIRTTVATSQGAEPAWVPAYPVLGNYCLFSFLPGGIVTKHPDQHIYQVEPTHTLQKLAFCGAILGWSLDFPDISVQKVLGPTSSKAGYRVPSLRRKILTAVVAGSAQEISFSDIRRKVEDETVKRGDVDNNIRALAEQRLVETHTNDVTTDVLVEILDPSFRGGRIPFDQLEPITRLTYKAFGVLWGQNRRQIDFNDLAETVLALEPQADLTALRKLWSMAIPDTSKNLPGIRKISRAIQDPSKFSTIRLRSDHAEAITNLLDRLHNLQTNPDIVVTEQQLALSLIKNQHAMREIFTKARQFSAQRARQEVSRASMSEHIFDIVHSGESVTTKDVAEQLRCMGKPLTNGTIRQYLNDLADNGKITKTSTLKGPASKRLVWYYSPLPITEEEN